MAKRKTRRKTAPSAKNWDEMKLGKASAIFFGTWMVALWILAKFGYYTETAQMMQSFHLFFNMSVLGLVLGTAEALFYGFLCGYIIAWLYNKL